MNRPPPATAEGALRELVTVLEDAIELHRPPTWPGHWLPRAMQAVQLGRVQLERIHVARTKGRA